MGDPEEDSKNEKFKQEIQNMENCACDNSVKIYDDISAAAFCAF